ADGRWMPSGGIADDQGFHIEAADGSPIRLDDSSNPVTDDGRRYLIHEGDLLDCQYVSQLWQPDSGTAYPFAQDFELVEEGGRFPDPPELTGEEVPGDEVIELADGRLVGDCTRIEMPDRTSQAHFEFVYTGAVAGSGYGQGGQSHAGMMPGFGGLLPPELIQAVVDYERGL
ncbi:MAG: hypothetical protein GY939_13760, partial [Actinomycetia bacterium]|nr:hypothetical protein [Actinomycetes bacterium]